MKGKPLAFRIMKYSPLTVNKTNIYFAFDALTDADEPTLQTSILVREVLPLDWKKIWREFVEWGIKDNFNPEVIDMQSKLEELVEKAMVGE